MFSLFQLCLERFVKHSRCIDDGDRRFFILRKKFDNMLDVRDRKDEEARNDRRDEKRFRFQLCRIRMPKHNPKLIHTPHPLFQ